MIFEMKSINPQFLVDDRGNKTSVLLSISDYEALMEEIDDVEDVRLFDQAIGEQNGESISLDEYMKKRGLIKDELPR